ncbi:Os05g0346000 [Oryza sativa Japonica Group]|uniref:Os05g0346000 protein n=2 Tax=Oryza sativa subsp. japonica TaxID=39947 RepID=B9FP10_ORYSJ|nr:hypothetical protein OsJ_18160 [Oryza sativa Japonica Group]BAS93497.1 Os05g0346000 [Oryza sativa Japonica Group]
MRPPTRRRQQEVQTRSPLAVCPSLTPTSCRLWFRRLHRRFFVGDGGVASAVEKEEMEDEAEGSPDAPIAYGWMDELRRLRAAELHHEVE